MKKFVLNIIPIILFISIFINIVYLFDIKILADFLFTLKSISSVVFSISASVVVFCLLHDKNKVLSDIGLGVVCVNVLLLLIYYILLKTVNDFSILKYISKILLISSSLDYVIKALFYSGILILLDNNIDSKASTYKNLSILFIFIYEIMLIISLWKIFSINSMYLKICNIIYQIFEVFTITFIVKRFSCNYVDDNTLSINNANANSVVVGYDKVSSNSRVVDFDKIVVANTNQSISTISNNGVVNQNNNSFQGVNNINSSASNNVVQGKSGTSINQDSLFPDYVDGINSNPKK